MAYSPPKYGWLKIILFIVLVFYVYNNHSRIDSLKRQVRNLRNTSPPRAKLIPGVEGYQVINHNLGSATIMLEDVKDHENGCVVLLVFTNATSVDINGFTMRISYPISSGSVETSLMFDTEIKLASGKATKHRFILDGTKPEELNYIAISNFKPKGIQIFETN